MLTKLTRARLMGEREDLEKNLVFLTEKLNRAVENGDLRESAEFDIAKEDYTLAKKRLLKVEDLLEEEVVDDEISNTITYGSLLSIKYLGETDSPGRITHPDPNPQTYMLVFDREGESIISGVLNEDSDLGQLVKDGRDGMYFLSKGRRSLVYDISILGEEYHQVFLEKFPIDRRKRIENLLGGSLS